MIALLQPGDAFVFSGAQPHGALVVGDALLLGLANILAALCLQSKVLPSVVNRIRLCF